MVRFRRAYRPTPRPDKLGNYFEESTQAVDVSALLKAVQSQVTLIEQLREHVEKDSISAGKRAGLARHPVKTAGVKQGERKSSRLGYKRLYCLKIPLWTVTIVWQLSVAQAHAGWDVSMSTFSLRSGDSLVFRLAEAGDVLGAWQLISRGEASLWDCSSDRRGRMQHCTQNILFVSKVTAPTEVLLTLSSTPCS